MLYTALSRAYREITEHMLDHPEQYRQHADQLHALQEHLAEALEALAHPAAT